MGTYGVSVVSGRGRAIQLGGRTLVCIGTNSLMETSGDRGYMVLTQSVFTHVAFQLLSLLDRGRQLDFESVRKAADRKELIEFLERSFPFPTLDVSHVQADQRKEANLVLTDIALALWDWERRKLGVEKNGIALAMAYCLEAASRMTPKDKRADWGFYCTVCGYLVVGEPVIDATAQKAYHRECAPKR
jgi:hypothetical protein